MASLLVPIVLLALAGTTVLADPRFAFPEDVNQRFSGSRIVSGWEAVDGQFPHQLSLRLVGPAGGTSACGASIISAEWAVTAAHCTAGRVTLVIRFGGAHMFRPRLIFETDRYINHPLYDESNQPVVQPNDIGLIDFGRRVEFNDFIKPIRLQSSVSMNRVYAGEQLTASGWGRDWTQGIMPDILNWVYLTGVSNEECSEAYGGSNIVGPSTICARYFNVTSQSTCQGDSGGPLTIVDDDGQITLVGVTSFVSALGCHVGRPAGFVRPGHYHEWFTQITGENFDWTPATPEPTATTERNVTTEEVYTTASFSDETTIQTTTEKAVTTPDIETTVPTSKAPEPSTPPPTPEEEDDSSSSSSSSLRRKLIQT